MRLELDFKKLYVRLQNAVQFEPGDETNTANFKKII